MTLPQLRQPSPFDVFRLFFVGAIWGASFLFVEVALVDLGPITIASFRIGLGAFVLLCACVYMKQSFIASTSDWPWIVAVGFLNSALPFFLISWGQLFVSGAESALLMATGTFIALLLSHYLRRDEQINLPRALGVIVGFSGVFVLVVSELFQAGLGALKGQIAIMGAAVSYATSAVLARRISHLPPISTSTAIMLSASVYMLPLAFLLEQPFSSDISNESIIAIGYLGIFATALAFLIRFHIIRDNGAVFMSMVGYLVPLFGVIWSWMFLSEAVTMRIWLALAMILAGIAITRRA